MRPAEAIWEFAADDMRPHISIVDIVRLRWNAGAAVASDGVTLMAIPVSLDEDDVTGPIEAEALRAAMLAAMPVVGEIDAWEDHEDFNDYAIEVRREMIDVHLTPFHLVTEIGVYLRGADGKQMPPVENLIKGPRDGKPIAATMAFSTPHLAHIAKLIGPAVLLTQSEVEGPILVRPLAWDDANTSGPIAFHGVDLPWALLMPMKQHEEPKRINSAEKA